MNRRSVLAFAAALAALLYSSPASAQQARSRSQRTCEDLFQVPGLIWRGMSPTMTLEQLARYAAPVYWLSPDEPTLERRRGRDIRVPTAFPFEPTAGVPVVYYQATSIASRPNADRAPIDMNARDKGQSILHLDSLAAVKLKYLAYFPHELGVGGHAHDVEPAEFRLVIGQANGPLARDLGFNCDASDYLIVITRVTGEAHGNPWYYNVLQVDEDTTLPIHLLVEEGKHAMATDKNADGYYTPGYDVTVRINDAWGVRDTMRGGTLFSGNFEAWMAKVRQPQHRVLPPLPADSKLPARLTELGVNPAELATYELRPYPASSLATDPALRKKIVEKETDAWPVVTSSATFRPVVDALAEGRELKPFSLAYRIDKGQGFAVSFPLLVLKNVPEPLTGGYLVNRVFVRGESSDHPASLGWSIMYTPSASRWFDQYLSAGIDMSRNKRFDDTIDYDTQFTAEVGFKFRFRAPTRAFAALTPFWGVRLGVKSVGGLDIDGLAFVFEVGGGVW